MKIVAGIEATGADGYESVPFVDQPTNFDFEVVETITNVKRIRVKVGNRTGIVKVKSTLEFSNAKQNWQYVCDIVGVERRRVSTRVRPAE